MIKRNQRTTVDNLEERMGEVADLIAAAESISDSLRTAEAVEVGSDFDANLDNAITETEALLKALHAVRA